MEKYDVSSWQSGSKPAGYPVLADDINAEVVIVGGGLAGVVSAYLLAKAGKQVVLLEKDTIGSGVTAYTTAFLTQHIDDGPDDLAKLFGKDGARLVWESGAAAMDEVEKIIRDEDISCDFSRCFAYIYAQTAAQKEGLVLEQKAAKELGFSVELTEGGLPFKNEGYLVIPNQAKFHPLKFLHALAVRATAAGVRIFEHTPVVSLSEHDAVSVTTKSGHTVHAQDVIVATHWPFNNPKPTHWKKGKYRSYVLELAIAKGAIKEGIYWDQANPYTYFRVDKNGDLDRMALGGADHRADLPLGPGKNFKALERYAKNILEGIDHKIIRRWDGPIIEASDGLPLIGAYAPHRYVATAFSGNGITFAVISALMFRDQILGLKNPWTKLYDPTRKLGLYCLWKKGTGYVARFFGGALKNTFSG